MKPFYLLALLPTTLFIPSSTAQALPPAAGSWSAQPTFVEEFNGTELDKKKWSTGYRWADVINDEMQGFVPENVSVENGICKLKVEKRPVQNTNWVGYKSQKKEYASGAIQTYAKWAQQYGYFEVRAKMPGGKGTWPAFWMLPDRGPAFKTERERTWMGTMYDGKNIGRGIEIDIFEIMGSWTDPKTGNGKSHAGYFWGYDGKSAWGGYALANNGAGPEHYIVPNQTTEFHTYGLAWGPGQLDYYIDGVKVLTREEAPSMTKIGSAPHYMILNVALKYDDWTPKKIPIAEIDADLPRTMEIDYVKAWSGTPTPSPAPIPDGTYRMTPLSNPTLALEVDGGSQDDAVKVVQGPYTGAPNQQWAISYLGGGVYEIKAAHSGKLLSVVADSGADRAKVDQQTDADRVGQRWRVQPVKDGYNRLAPMTNPKSAFSTYGKNAGAGGYIFYSSGDPGQRWKFEPIKDPATPPTVVAQAAPAAVAAAAPKTETTKPVAATTPPTTTVTTAAQVSPVSPAAPAAATPAVTEPVAPAPAVPTVPRAPVGVAMTANSPGSITLTWFRPANPDVTGYNVYTSEGKDGPFTRLATVKERTATHTGLAPDTTRFYRVAAVNAQGEGPQSPVTNGFTFKPVAATPLPVKVAKNMCVTLGQPVVSDAKPISGKLEFLADGSDVTSCRLRKQSEIRIRLNPDQSIADAEYLLLNVRTHATSTEWSNDAFARTLRNYVILESLDSTDGKDGTWTEVVTGNSDQLDNVIVLPNHKPKWIAVRSTGGTVIPADDRRPAHGDLMLTRLDVFRAAPKGFRNDYWIFTGDSLVVQDMPAGAVEGRSAYFSDLIRKQHPDRYPLVVHAGRGGEIMNNTTGRMKGFLPVLAAPNGSTTPTGTFLCFEPGFNDIGLQAGLWIGEKIKKNLAAAQEVAAAHGLLLVPVRLEFATAYLNPETLEPNKDTTFHNTLAANLAGVDVYAREHAPWAVDTKTQVPYADYWTAIRENPALYLAKDGVHHTKEGVDRINRLWADVASKMVYSKQ